VAANDDQDWSRIDEVPALVSRLYDIVDESEELFPGRHFTPDCPHLGMRCERSRAASSAIRA